MELFLLSMLLLLILFFSLTPKFFYKHKSKLPPGKMGWPVLGESLEFIKNGRRGVPEKFITDRMKKFSSQVFTTSLFGEPTAVFCGAMGNKFLFTNENKLVKAWFPRSIDKIIPSARQDFPSVRKLLTSFIKPEALYIGIMDVIARRHLETNWGNNKEVMVFSLAKKYTFSVACRLFLSIDDSDQLDKFADNFGMLCKGLISIPIDLPGTRFHRAIKAASLMRNDLCAIIKERKIDLAEKKALPTQDLLSHLLITSDENGLFMNENIIADKILGFLFAGDTASTVITFIVKYLSELPQVYEAVLKEQKEIAVLKRPGEMLNWDDIQKMKYSWNVVCEVMRLSPPGQGAFREAIADFTYAGFSIPKGFKLYWTMSSTNTDTDCFPEPEKFNPSRFEGYGPAPYSYVPFGGGPRMCPGKEYARLEILVFMHNLVRTYEWEKLIPNEKIIADPTPIPAKGLPVRLRRHNTH